MKRTLRRDELPDPGRQLRQKLSQSPAQIINVKYPRRPDRVMLQPENAPLAYEYKNGQIDFNLEKLDIHSIIEID